MGRNVCVSIMKRLMFFLLRLRRGYKNMRAKEVNMLFCKFPNDDWVAARRSLEKRETSCDCDFFHTLPKIKNIENSNSNNNNNRLWGRNLEWDEAWWDRFTYGASGFLSATHETDGTSVSVCLTRSRRLATTRLALFKREWQALIWIWPSSPSYLCRCCMPSRKRKKKKCSSSHWNTQKIKRRPRATQCQVAVIKISNAWILQNSSVPC